MKRKAFCFVMPKTPVDLYLKRTMTEMNRFLFHHTPDCGLLAISRCKKFSEVQRQSPMNSFSALSKVSLLFGFVCLSAGSAHAGSWSFDHYVVDIDSHGTAVYEDEQGKFSASPLGRDGHGADFWNGTESHLATDDPGGSSLVHQTDLITCNNIDKDPPIVKGWQTMTVTPYFRWNPSNDHDPVPKYIYIKEMSTVYTAFEGDVGYGSTQEHPYTGQGFHIDSFSDGFKSPAKDLGHVNPLMGGDGSGPFLQANGQYGTYHFSTQTTGGKTLFPGASRTLHVQVSTAPGAPIGDLRLTNHVWCWFEYSASIASVGLSVRRKGTENWGSSADIEAGHFGTDEHKSEVMVSVGVPDVPRSKLPPLFIHEDTKPGVVQPATVENTENDKTDANGILVWKIVTSKDKISATTPGTLPEDGPVIAELDLGEGYTHPTAAIHHVWASVQWKMGENGDKEYSPHFLIANDSGYAEWIWTKVTSAATGLPLDTHNLQFSVRRLVVREENAQTGDVVTKIFTSDAAESIQENIAHLGDNSYQVIYQKDIDSLVGAYMTLPTATSDGPGIYKGVLTIKKGLHFSVDQYELKLKDANVYYNSGS